MSILETLLSGQNANTIAQIAKSAGIDQGTAQNIIGQLMPAITSGIKSNAMNNEGLGGLVNALNSGKHQQYIDNPEVLNEASTVEDGNAILGHIFGSKDVSRHVASDAAQATGADVGIIKQLLPLVAATAMGALSKQTAGGNLLANAAGGADNGSMASMITSFLDADKDGDIADDVLNLARKFF